MNETSKAMTRRWVEDMIGDFPWKSLFVGKGIDVGCGPDKVQIDDCIGFDQGDGDANDLCRYFKSNTFDYLHASHILEHMKDAKSSLTTWSNIVKKGGHIIGEVPSWELYEGKRPRSIWNDDHKSTWSMWNKFGGTELPHHYAPDFFKSDLFDIKLLRLVDSNYDYTIGASIDQTNTESNAVECFIEFVLIKK